MRSSVPADWPILIAAAGDEIERERKLTPQVFSALHEGRLFRLLMPASVNGEEVEPIVFLETLEEIGKADASTAWCISQTSVCSMWAALLREDVAKRIFVSRRRPHRFRIWRQHARGPLRGRLPGDGKLGFRQRRPSRHLVRRGLHVA